MADRFTIHPAVNGWHDIYDESRGRYMAICPEVSDAGEIVAALNAVAKLKKAVWGPEGVPAWLEGSDK